MTSHFDGLPEFFIGRNILVYDGECPFCTRYAKLVRIRDALGVLHLVDAREGGQEYEWLTEKGFDLDEGMVFVFENTLHHGDRALFQLAVLSTPIGAFNRLNRIVFANHSVARVIYPAFRAARNATLRVLRRTKLVERKTSDRAK